MEKTTFEGQKIYSNLVLKVYDFVVLFFNNRFAWRCKTPNILKVYSKNLSSNHLDIGVGSAYFLRKNIQKLNNVSLMDLNDNCLNYVENKLVGKNVTKNKIDILKPIDSCFENMFDSISCNYLIHCLPNNGNKDIVFENIAKMLKKDGKAFGSIVINDYDNFLAKRIAKKFNAKGIFDNENDTYQSIDTAIKANFATYSINQIGAVCIFEMSDPIKK